MPQQGDSWNEFLLHQSTQQDSSEIFKSSLQLSSESLARHHHHNISVHDGVRLYWHWQDKKSHAISGVLTSSAETSSSFPILSVGLIHIMLASPNGVFLSDEKEPLLSLRVEGNRLFVSTAIRNEKGDLIAELKDNEWTLQQQPAIFDRNYTNSILEVRNSTGNIALQIVDLGNTIHVAGIFHCRNGWTTVMGSNGSMGAVLDVRPPGVEAHYKIPSICEYPSATHFGSCPGLQTLKSLIDSVPVGSSYMRLTTPVNACGQGTGGAHVDR